MVKVWFKFSKTFSAWPSYYKKKKGWNLLILIKINPTWNINMPVEKTLTFCLVLAGSGVSAAFAKSIEHLMIVLLRRNLQENRCVVYSKRRLCRSCVSAHPLLLLLFILHPPAARRTARSQPSLPQVQYKWLSQQSPKQTVFLLCRSVIRRGVEEPQRALFISVCIMLCREGFYKGLPRGNIQWDAPTLLA